MYIYYIYGNIPVVQIWDRYIYIYLYHIYLTIFYMYRRNIGKEGFCVCD